MAGRKPAGSQETPAPETGARFPSFGVVMIDRSRQPGEYHVALGGT
jgi:hypothetical protein